MSILLTSPANGAVVSLATERQISFHRNEEERSKTDGNLTFQWWSLEEDGKDGTRPLPVRFRFRDSEGKGDYLLLVSERADLKGATVLHTRTHSAALYNLKASTQYFWCIQKDGIRSDVRTFSTAKHLPRCLFVDGVPNFRDFGGYETPHGTVRQGLLFRGSEFEIHAHITSNGIAALRALGIRTELDMRGEAKGKVLYPTSRALGLRYALIPSCPYDGFFTEQNLENAKQWFTLISKKAAYPIYFHCWGGADRTGTYAFLLGAFLGMKREDLIYEYEFTALSVWGMRTRNYEPFIRFLSILESFPGNCDEEKATYFLKEKLSLSDKTLTAIKEILIEPYEA